MNSKKHLIFLTVTRKGIKRPVLVNARAICWAESAEYADPPRGIGTLIRFKDGQSLVVEEGLNHVFALLARPELSARRGEKKITRGISQLSP